MTKKKKKNKDEDDSSNHFKKLANLYPPSYNEAADRHAIQEWI